MRHRAEGHDVFARRGIGQHERSPLPRQIRRAFNGEGRLRQRARDDERADGAVAHGHGDVVNQPARTRRAAERKINVMPHEINQLPGVGRQIVFRLLPTAGRDALQHVERDGLGVRVGNDGHFAEMNEVVLVLEELVVLHEAQRGLVAAGEINGRADEE